MSTLLDLILLKAVKTWLVIGLINVFFQAPRLHIRSDKIKYLKSKLLQKAGTYSFHCQNSTESYLDNLCLNNQPILKIMFSSHILFV